MVRITMKDLRADKAIRHVEMIVESIITDWRQSIQFWKDVNLYGFGSAINSLKRYVPDGDFTELDKLHDSMQRTKKSNLSIGQFDYVNEG